MLLVSKEEGRKANEWKAGRGEPLESFPLRKFSHQGASSHLLGVREMQAITKSPCKLNPYSVTRKTEKLCEGKENNRICTQNEDSLC